MDERGPSQQRQVSRRALGRLSWPTACMVFSLFAVAQFAPSMARRVARCDGAPTLDVTLDVRVTFQGKPVAMAQVVALDREDRLRAVTDRDGKARIRLARDGKLNCIVAFDAKFGLGGRWFGVTGEVPAPPRTVLELPLAAAKPHTIRVIDDKGKPVRLASINLLSVMTEQEWLQPGLLEASHLHTNSRGEAPVGWMPADVKGVGLEVSDDRWKLDRCQTQGGVTVAQVRPLHPVDGRLSLPEGNSPAGMWITGTGMGGAAIGHRPSARVRKDGTFTLYVAADHAYSLCLVDKRWATDSWTGVILSKEGAAPKELNFVAYPAVTLSVLVTRGPKHDPVEGAWVMLRSGDQFQWHDVQGQVQLEGGGPQVVVYTDKRGRAEFAVGKGMHEICLATDDWRHHQTVEVDSAEPVSLGIHHPRTGKHSLSGRLLRDGRPYHSGPETVVRGSDPNHTEVTAQPVVSPEGTFSLSLDAGEIYVFAVDSKNHLSAARLVGAAEASVVLDLKAMGRIRGTVVDSNGNPLAGHILDLVFAGPDFWMFESVHQATTSDNQGNFKFDAVPTGVPLRVYAGVQLNPRAQPFSKQSGGVRTYSSRELTLNPGEVRDLKFVKKIKPSDN
jgi:hypothetical protein